MIVSLEDLCWSASLLEMSRIAAGEGRFNANSDITINTEVKSVPVTKKGIYFAFRDQGACISLLAIKFFPFEVLSYLS
ncbi:hypothetical protein RUM43_014487 [Polyplax serrata]|uniref:Eph LBD domain-containing protein n=1 Tax=Polyplax serrata TaxID=468196 RepID=A0AAN8NVM3_POLSC